MAKARIAFFDFASCEGCQIEMTNFGDAAFLELLNHVEIVEFIDVALIEGSFTREADRARLEEIRRRARVVIAYGQCAATGGINALKNHQTDYKEAVYGQDAGMPHLDSDKALPISVVIKVDYNAFGCPINKYEVLQLLSHLVHGKEPVIPSYPVCVDCKRRETVCRYHEEDHCLGPVARAGCGAPCPASGVPCEACRGLVDDANLASIEKVLVERAGFSASRAAAKRMLWTANQGSESK